MNCWLKLEKFPLLPGEINPGGTNSVTVCVLKPDVHSNSEYLRSYKYHTSTSGSAATAGVGKRCCCFCSTPRVFQLPPWFCLRSPQLTSESQTGSVESEQSELLVLTELRSGVRTESVTYKHTYRHSLTLFLCVCVSRPHALCETDLCAAGGNRLSQEGNELFVSHLDSPPP